LEVWKFQTSKERGKIRNGNEKRSEVKGRSERKRREIRNLERCNPKTSKLSGAKKTRFYGDLEGLT
jgi:hypothetical protein